MSEIKIDSQKLIMKHLDEILRHLNYAEISFQRASRDNTMYPAHMKAGTGQVNSAGLDIKRAKDLFVLLKLLVKEYRKNEIPNLISQCDTLLINSVFFTERDLPTIRRLQDQFRRIKEIIITRKPSF
jgi:hypothetical protein